METPQESTSFHLLVMTCFCVAGFLASLFIGLRATGFNTVTSMYTAIFAPLIILPTLIYSYAKNKNPFFKRFCYVIIFFGLPWVLILFAQPIVASISSIRELIHSSSP